MKSKSLLAATLLVKTTILSVAITWVNLPLKVEAFTTSLIQNDLYFGRNITGDGTVSESQFQNFLSNVITPKFPDGLTVFDANGQYLIGTDVIKEPSKMVTIFFDNTQQNQASISQIMGGYMQQFNQSGVLQVTKYSGQRKCAQNNYSAV